MTRLPPSVENELRAGNLLREPVVTALAGGVSCDIWQVTEEGNTFVVKQALPQLRVSQEWLADPARNQHEQQYLAWVGERLPSAVPKILFTGKNFFVMEFLRGMADWKSHLLAGRCEAGIARQVGAILGTIHDRSWEKTEVAKDFAYSSFFEELRISPYLRATAAQHPELAGWILQEADRLTQAKQALIHGDFSPKNLMVGGGRVVVLDCEVACYGDPAFDVAFLTNHLLLKSLHLPQCRSELLQMARTFLESYATSLGLERFAHVCQNVPALLLCLLLARVDGKSPAEYLSELEKAHIRSFVSVHIPHPPLFPEPFLEAWSTSLPQ